MNHIQIKTIEDLSLNAWPSHQIQIYDGWLLRFSYFYTHRTNCVEQIGSSSIPLDTKIAYCEDTYRKWGTPSIFKISPLLPAGFDKLLDGRGYVKEHITDVMTLQLSALTEIPVSAPVHVSSFFPDSWIQALFALKGTTNIMHRLVVPSMYRAIPMETICVSIQDGRRIAATGLGILDRDYIGIYAIHVHPAYRRRRYASAVCRTILQNGRRKGAKRAYLQVVADNQPAINLYHSLGFSYAYTCWFRTKHLF